MGKKIHSRRNVIVEPAYGQIHTRQGKHLLIRGLGNDVMEWKLLAA